MSRQHARCLIQRFAERAGVLVPDQHDEPRPATGLHFRRGAALHQLRTGVLLTQAQQQLGHARLDSTTVYTRPASSERRPCANPVER